jgi:hypothetical protein
MDIELFESVLETACEEAIAKGYHIRPTGFLSSDNFEKACCPIGAYDLAMGFHESFNTSAKGPAAWCAETAEITLGQVWSFIQGFDASVYIDPQRYISAITDRNNLFDPDYCALGAKFRKRYYVDSDQPVKAPKVSA